MRNLDFGSWQALLSTLLGLSVFTFIGVGIRLLVMQTVQVRRERENRQINERLRTLIAAYKTLGGSFTGDLTVDPTHMRDLRRKIEAREESREGTGSETDGESGAAHAEIRGERSRRIRDAVEAALSDVLLLGTEEQVRLAARAATELVEGRSVETAELVVSLRNFIRSVLDLDPVPVQPPIPKQGPSRPITGKGKGEGGSKGGASGAKGMGGGGGGVAIFGGSDDESDRHRE